METKKKLKAKNGSYRVDRQTNKQTPLKTSTSLRYMLRWMAINTGICPCY